ncbi:hypothetical protein [Paraliobacillus sp. X-1268]|uniref:hypothetical protein n=1 Tax=Paraliobacillus sp. X-1268 TaxID=2213193 RepID=UPI000E3C88D3|nr:hypothetical protein [Paraliobacillus sp. X-1268]
MSRLYLFGSLFFSFLLLFGCSSNSPAVDSNEVNEQKGEQGYVAFSKKENAEAASEVNKNESIGDIFESTSQPDNRQEEKESLKETLRTYIFDQYMGSSDYGYAKGVNWTENFYDNLTAEEIWNVIEEYKQLNNGEEGTLFEQASYLTIDAPIKDNWKEMFLGNWNNSPYSDSNEIETMIDKGDAVWIFTDTLPYTGEEDNYPFITLFKKTGFWHG